MFTLAPLSTRPIALRIALCLCCAIVAMLSAASACAELQSITVGGQLVIRGRAYINAYTGGDVPRRGRNELRIPAEWLGKRPVGEIGVSSLYDWDDRDADRYFAEMNISISVKADFSQQVTAYAEIDNCEMWGDDFRANYVTGTDGRDPDRDHIDLFQGYIEAHELFGYPLTLRVGRQAMVMGKGWLVGDYFTATQRFSFDAVRLTYVTGDWEVDAWTSKLRERTPLEEDGDGDFYGVYATYKGFKPVSISAYWLLLHDGSEINDTRTDPLSERVEDWLGLDQYPNMDLHTVGLRAWGERGPWDYDAEMAYQWGDVPLAGMRFTQASAFGLYGDDDAQANTWGADVEAGYTFDAHMSPRVFAGGVYFGGDDNRDLGFWEWLNPFDQPEASISFNRLFSRAYYAPVLLDNTHISNITQVRTGIEITPAEKWWMQLRLAHFWANATFDWPVYVNVGRARAAIAPDLPFWTTPSDDDLGTTAELTVKYKYSDDLSLTLYWGYLVTGEGTSRDGNYIFENGLAFSGGSDEKDSQYITLLSKLTF